MLTPSRASSAPTESVSDPGFSAVVIAMQLAHQLCLSLGQAAGGDEFVDAGAHADQAGGLAERQAGRIALFQSGKFVRQRADDGPQFMQVFAHTYRAVLEVVQTPCQIPEALVTQYRSEERRVG